MIRIRGIVKQQKNIQQQIGQLNPNSIRSQEKSIRKALSNCVQEIEKICQENQGSLTDLTTTTRKIYGWMKFLSDDDYLKLHIKTIKKLQSLVEKTLKSQPSDISEIQVSLTNYNGLYKYKKTSQKKIELQLSEGFIQAETKILQEIINIVLWGKNYKAQQMIRQFGLTEKYREIILELDMITEIEVEKSQGDYYDLEQLFHQVNQQCFKGEMSKPRLTWNKILTYRKLGHYEPIRDRVVISRILDSCDVPSKVVAFVLYHELLHKNLGCQWVNGKRMVHTAEFKRREKDFPYYDEVQEWLKGSLIKSM